MIEQFQNTLDDIANDNARIFALLGPDPKAHTATLQRMIAAADVFYGLLPDGGKWLVKGDARLNVIASGAVSVPMAIGAVNVRSPEEAEAMRLVFGDGSTNMRSTSAFRLHRIDGGKP